jgi:hypothetical protein
MRKIIVMALAGFIWRKFQSRVSGRANTSRPMHRY